MRQMSPTGARRSPEGQGSRTPGDPQAGQQDDAGGHDAGVREVLPQRTEETGERAAVQQLRLGDAAGQGRPDPHQGFF